MEELTLRIEAVGPELKWRAMPLDRFNADFVDVISSLSDVDLAMVITRLSEKSFDNLLAKHWTEQDILPSDEYDAYELSKPIMVSLRRCLLCRQRMEFGGRLANQQQQLAMITLILNPRLVATASGINL